MYAAARYDELDPQVRDALTVARALHNSARPSVSDPSGRRLYLDDPNDLATAHSLAIGRQHFASGGGVGHADIGYSGDHGHQMASAGHDIDDIIDGALSIARQHLRNGGVAFGAAGLQPSGIGEPAVAAPISRGGPAVRTTPVLPGDLAHAYGRHLLHGRARFAHGGTVADALHIAHLLNRPRFDNGGLSEGGFAPYAGSVATPVMASAGTGSEGGTGAGPVYQSLANTASEGGTGASAAASPASDASGINLNIDDSSFNPRSMLGLSGGQSMIGLAHGGGVRLRPRFDDGGGDGGGGGGDSGGGDGGNSNGDGAASSGSSDSSGGYGIGGFGGAVGSVSSGSSDSGSSGNDWGGGGYSSLGVSGDTSGSAVSNAVSSLNSLGPSNTGYSYSKGPSSGSSYSGGDIGSSGIAAGGGFSAADTGSSTGAGGLAGFGNFGGSALGDGTNNTVGATYGGYNQGGLNSNEQMGYGDSDAGYSPFGNTVANSFGEFGSGVSSPSALSGIANYGNLSGTGFNTEGELSNAGSYSVPASSVLSALGLTSVPAHTGLFGNFSESDDPTANAEWTGAQATNLDPSLTGISDNPYGLGTTAQPGFNNFNQGIGALTAPLAANTGVGTPSTMLGGYTPAGWSPDEERLDMATSPGDYADPAMFSKLGPYTGFNSFTTNFGKGYLGNDQAEAGPGLPTNAINATGGDLGLSQWTGARQAGLLSDLGIDPGLSTTDLKAALTPATLSTQMMYGLNEIATNPAYKATLSAATNPDLSATQDSNIIAAQYEAPPVVTNGLQANATASEIAASRQELARRASYANSYGGTVDANAVASGLGNIGGGAMDGTQTAAPGAGLSAAGASPTSTTTQDLNNALSTFAGENPDRQSYVTGYQNGQFSDLSQASPGQMSGEDSETPDQLAAEAKTWNSPTTAFTDAASLDAAIKAAQPASTPATSTVSNLTSGAPATAAPDTDTTQVGDPLTITPNTPVTPSIAQKLATTGINVVTGIANPIVGAVNLASGLLGGPTVGGVVTSALSNLTPGQPTNPNGNAGSNGGAYYSDSSVNSGAAPYYLPSSSEGGASSSSSTTNTQTTAQQAYLAALKNLPGPGAAARVSNPVALRAPGQTTTALYNPLSDPLVQAGLRAAQAYS